jgi:hypothetical protein
LKKTATEKLSLLCEVYGENTLSRAHVFQWHKKFSEGREGLEDDTQPFSSESFVFLSSLKKYKD